MPSTHAQLGSAAYETLGRISGPAADIRSGKDTHLFHTRHRFFHKTGIWMKDQGQIPRKTGL
jgi:hypothetical protein